jgi:hypothetical protein
MQQILPIFPDAIRMINYQVGFKQIDDFVIVVGKEHLAVGKSSWQLAKNSYDCQLQIAPDC